MSSLIRGYSPMRSLIDKLTRLTARNQIYAGNGTCSSNAVTISKLRGVITTEALSTAANGTQAIVLTNTTVSTADGCICNVRKGTCTTGTPAISNIAIAANTVTITVKNIHSSAAFDGNLQIGFLVLRQP